MNASKAGELIVGIVLAVCGVLPQAGGRGRGIAKDAGMSMAQLAVAWQFTRPTITSPIVGASRPEQLDDAIRAAERIERILHDKDTLPSRPVGDDADGPA